MRTLTSVIGAAGSVFLLTHYAVNVIREESRRAKIEPCEPWPISVPTPHKKGTRP